MEAAALLDSMAASGDSLVHLLPRDVVSLIHAEMRGRLLLAVNSNGSSHVLDVSNHGTWEELGTVPFERGLALYGDDGDPSNEMAGSSLTHIPGSADRRAMVVGGEGRKDVFVCSLDNRGQWIAAGELPPPSLDHGLSFAGIEGHAAVVVQESTWLMGGELWTAPNDKYDDYDCMQTQAVWVGRSDGQWRALPGAECELPDADLELLVGAPLGRSALLVAAAMGMPCAHRLDVNSLQWTVLPAMPSGAKPYGAGTTSAGATPVPCLSLCVDDDSGDETLVRADRPALIQLDDRDRSGWCTLATRGQALDRLDSEFVQPRSTDGAAYVWQPFNSMRSFDDNLLVSMFTAYKAGRLKPTNLCASTLALCDVRAPTRGWLPMSEWSLPPGAHGSQTRLLLVD